MGKCTKRSKNNHILEECDLDPAGPMLDGKEATL